MSEIVYLLCALTAAACFVLLWRGWRRSRTRLLFWSALCFAGLSANNVLLVLDKVLTPVQETLTVARLLAALLGVSLLLWGLISEER